MEKNYLPLGSAVLLKGATRPVIVIGYMVMEEGSKEVWDYLGCAHPIGVVGSNKQLLFNKEQVEKVLHVGYSDDEGNKFLKSIEESVDMIKHGGE